MHDLYRPWRIAMLATAGLMAGLALLFVLLLFLVLVGLVISTF